MEYDRRGVEFSNGVVERRKKGPGRGYRVLILVRKVYSLYPLLIGLLIKNWSLPVLYNISETSSPPFKTVSKTREKSFRVVLTRG